MTRETAAVLRRARAKGFLSGLCAGMATINLVAAFDQAIPLRLTICCAGILFLMSAMLWSRAIAAEEASP
jgi:hypothetical protein